MVELMPMTYYGKPSKKKIKKSINKIYNRLIDTIKKEGNLFPFIKETSEYVSILKEERRFVLKGSYSELLEAYCKLRAESLWPHNKRAYMQFNSNVEIKIEDNKLDNFQVIESYEEMIKIFVEKEIILSGTAMSVLNEFWEKNPSGILLTVQI